MLNHRAGRVLNILVNEYISSASPVASEEIARLSPDKVSPATVRNAMSQLAEAGYISRPHISAGAVPSDRGYRYYVESLEEPPPPSGLRNQLRDNIPQADPDLAAWSRRCAAILSSLATNMAIVTVPQFRSPRLKSLQLVYLEELTALLIIVLQEARLLRRLLPLEEPSSQEKLNQIANGLNDCLSGRNWAEIAAAPSRFNPLEEQVRQNALAMLRAEDNYNPPEHYVDGLRWLLNQPEMARGSQARELVELLEERVLLGSLLSELPASGDIAVYIGGENQEEPLRPFGVILCQYGVPQQAGGAICVIGPTRMSYAAAISGVRFLSTFMSRLVLDFYSGGAKTTSRPPE